MKIKCECGCVSTLPISMRINHQFGFICVNCNKKIMIMCLDEENTNKTKEILK